MTPLWQKLYRKVKETGYLSYGDMCQFTAEEGYKVGTAERRLRELAEDGKIENEIKKSKRGSNYISGYRLPQEVKIKRRPIYIIDFDGNRQLVGYESLTV